MVSPPPAARADLALGALLHQGAHGTLYSATRPAAACAQHVVVRRLVGTAPFAVERASSVLREAELGARARSPHLLTYVAVVQEPSNPCSVWEWVDGVHLGALLARAEDRTSAARLLLPAVVDALEGLAALHALSDDAGPLNVVHQAPVPRHILVGRDGAARLVDLTQAWSRLHGASSHGALPPHELAPEQVLAPGEVDARTDVFIAAATLVHVLTGKAPFAASDPREATQRLLGAELPTLSAAGLRVGMPLERLLRRALARDREERVATAAELAEQLRHLAAQAGLWATRDEVAAYVRAQRPGSASAPAEGKPFVMLRPPRKKPLAGVAAEPQEPQEPPRAAGEPPVPGEPVVVAAPPLPVAPRGVPPPFYSEPLPVLKHHRWLNQPDDASPRRPQAWLAVVAALLLAGLALWSSYGLQTEREDAAQPGDALAREREALRALVAPSAPARR